MGWLLVLLQFGPSIFHLAMEIWDLIKKVRHPQEAEAFNVELHRAVDEYRRTGNQGPLRELRDRLHKHCFGPVLKPVA